MDGALRIKKAYFFCCLLSLCLSVHRLFLFIAVDPIVLRFVRLMPGGVERKN